MTMPTKTKSKPASKSKAIQKKAAAALDKIERYEDHAEAAKRDYLHDTGWQYVCNTPGALWMWQKKLADGRTALVDTTTAIYFQADIDDGWDVAIETRGGME